MRKLLLSSVFAVFLFSLETGAVKAQTCTATPECAGLGYTKAKADCPKGALKCPTGDSYFCEEEKIEEKICKIGDIYYSDNTCGAEVDKTKTALGVVVYITDGGKHGQVISAWPIDANGNKGNGIDAMYWADYNGDNYDIAALPNYSTQESAATDFNSCNNTDKILADTQRIYLAARAVRLYAPTDETKGKWCLPAAGVLTSIYNNQSAIQAGISKLGGVEYPSCCTWSSSEYDAKLAWFSYFDYTNGLYYNDKYNFYSYSVRPVIEF